MRLDARLERLERSLTNGFAYMVYNAGGNEEQNKERAWEAYLQAGGNPHVNEKYFVRIQEIPA